MAARLFLALCALTSGLSVSVARAQPCEATRIPWAAGAGLHVGDFLATPTDPDHTAEANTGIATSSRAGADPATFVVEAEAFFDPCKSWFRRGATDSATLAHEQLHFDITEVFARRLLARYEREITDHRDFLRRHERLYDEVWRASRRRQEAYDTEVYADRARQAWWAAWTRTQLEATRAYAEGRIRLPM